MSIKIRRALKQDCPEIARMVKELDEFEKLPETPFKLSAKDFERDGFGDRPLFQCHVAEISPGQLCGYVLYCWTFVTWEGKGRSVQMEDLYVSLDHRGKGIGKSLLKSCVQDALDFGCSRLNFKVLEWNSSAIEFYKRQGAEDLSATKDGLLNYSIDHSHMKDLCNWFSVYPKARMTYLGLTLYKQSQRKYKKMLTASKIR